MILALLGLPSPLTSWCASVLSAMVSELQGECHVVQTTTVAELQAALDGRAGRPVVLRAEALTRELAWLIVNSGIRSVVVVEPPVAVAHQLKSERGLDMRGAAQAVGLSCSTLMDLVLADSPAIALLTTASRTDQLIAGLAAHYGLSAPAALVRKLADRMPLPPPVAVEPQALDPLLARCIAPFESLSARGAMTGVTWPAELFFRLDPPGGSLAGPIELLGGARILIYGPYLHVPPGRWIARADLTVRRNESGNILKIDAYQGGGKGVIIAQGKGRLPAEGRYAAELAFEIAEPREALEVRFYIEEGAIGGALELHEVTLRFVEAVAPDAVTLAVTNSAGSPRSP